ncbi:hypothetical protein GALMADRAFT_877982 [Galerina marginata CBS 339.88]|uniref:Uncharacterized protein n=1 Tax=Galerina marginata (strain CBS 339.88) TaxID=685588 RepID=A0A067SSA3_GALM3|nr:hypothetical protein GALMADRAFT_877982 [Galerina marginata CBS 339.88]
MSNDSDIEMSVIAKATVPFPLTPGVNLIAAFTLGIRQIFKHPALSGLGLFESSKIFWTSQLTAVYPDPSLTVLRGEDISTIRLFVHDDASPFRTVADYRENSVLDGFSAVGGLWTTLSGIFAILFGGSLFHLITGAKPLSIFGAAHSIAHFPAMRKSIMEHYPKLLVRETDGNRGLLEFLRDHLLDLKILEEPDLEMDEKGSPV